MPEFTAEELKNKTLEELAVLGERNDPLSAEGILIKEELQRRAKTEQHTAQLTKTWHETFVGKVIVGVIVGIILLFVTALITKHIISTPQQPPVPQPEQQQSRKWNQLNQT